MQPAFADDRATRKTRRLQLVTDVAVRRQRQTLLGKCRPTDLSAEPFELLALIRVYSKLYPE